jgi:hypothetical protein
VGADTQDILARERVPPATHLWILFVLWAVCIGSALIKVHSLMVLPHMADLSHTPRRALLRAQPWRPLSHAHARLADEL